MKEATSTAAMVVPEMETMEEEEEERYVQVESRFFRVKARGGGGTAAGSRRLHYLEHCFLCKGSIAGNRDVFMHKDAAFCSDDCREEQMDMDEALHAVAHRHRLLLTRAPPASSSSSSPAAEAAPAVRRRPTIANLAARNPPVAAS